MRVAKKWVGAAVLSFPVGLVLFFTAYFIVPFSVQSVEFSGACGMFRNCRSRYWGVTRHCGISRTQALTPFAPEGSCDGDWYSISEDSYRLEGSIAHVGSEERPARAINRLISTYRERASDHRTNGKYQRVSDRGSTADFASARRYKAADCAGKTNTISDDAYEIVLAANLDSDQTLDCWSVNDTGELRHISKD